MAVCRAHNRHPHCFRAFNPDVISRTVSKFIKQAEIDRPGSCHLLRHTCATHMREGGADIRFIQQLKAVHSQTHPSKRAKIGRDKAPETA